MSRIDPTAGRPRSRQNRQMPHVVDGATTSKSRRSGRGDARPGGQHQLDASGGESRDLDKTQVPSPAVEHFYSEHEAGFSLLGREGFISLRLKGKTPTTSATELATAFAVLAAGGGVVAGIIAGLGYLAGAPGIAVLIVAGITAALVFGIGAISVIKKRKL